MDPNRYWSFEEIHDTTIPRFTIDLSLKPKDRYVALAKQYKPHLQQLTFLFDTILFELGIPEGLKQVVKRVASSLLRRLHSPIETAELHGIFRAANVPMYVLVLFNVLLDLFMGCTSGATKSLETDQRPQDARMLHFRTLDWGMDQLRPLVVQLDYVQSTVINRPEVLGSSITYVGFLGILTGVRKRLSLSLNGRVVHDATTSRQHFRVYLHHLLVLLGLRPSISSLLRSCLFGSNRAWLESPKTLQAIKDEFPSKHTTAAYLIFCDGKHGVSMENDFKTAVIQESPRLLVTTNHDLRSHKAEQDKNSTSSRDAAIQSVLDDSEERRQSILCKWRAKLREERRARYAAFGESAHLDNIERTMTVTRQELVRWTTSYPTTNQCTHFAAILDPSMGQVLWSQRYLQPRQALIRRRYSI